MEQRARSTSARLARGALVGVSIACVAAAAACASARDDVTTSASVDDALAAPARMTPRFGHRHGALAFDVAADFGPSGGAFAVGDLDGDGRTDVVSLSAAGEGTDIWVMLARGDRGFVTSRAATAEDSGSGVALADLDRDGHLDVVMTAWAFQQATLNVFLGRGDGSVGPGRMYAIGDTPPLAGAVAITDLDGDGAPDVVVPGLLADAKLFLGNGDGTLRAAQALAVGDRPGALAFADFDGDCSIDIAVARWAKGTVRVLLNHGDATFADPRDYAAGISPVDVIAADFDRDGISDLAVADRGYVDTDGADPPILGKAPSAIEIFLGNGDGTFRTALRTPIAHVPHRLATGDLDGDGRLDLAYESRSRVAALLGRGDGTFAPEIPYATTQFVSGIAIGRVDRDHRPDVVVAGAHSAVSVFFGHGDGTLDGARAFDAGGIAWNLAVGDLDRDHRADLVVADVRGGAVSVLLGNGDGTFATQRTSAAGGTPQTIALGDVDGDHLLDAVVSGWAGTYELRGRGDGSFEPPRLVTVAPVGPSAIALADFNRDRRLDLALVGGLGQAFLFLGDGDGTFRPSAEATAGAGPYAIATGDVDGDHRIDLAVADWRGTVFVFFGAGDGTFAASASAPVDREANAIAAGDFDGDGRDDLAIGTHLWNGSLSVVHGRADRTLGPAESYPGLVEVTGLAVGDYDGDRRLDLAVARTPESDGRYGVVDVLLSGADGRFETPPHTFGVESARAVVTADFDRNGRLDLATAGNANDDVAVLLALPRPPRRFLRAP